MRSVVGHIERIKQRVLLGIVGRLGKIDLENRANALHFGDPCAPRVGFSGFRAGIGITDGTDKAVSKLVVIAARGNVACELMICIGVTQPPDKITAVIEHRLRQSFCLVSV